MAVKLFASIMIGSSETEMKIYEVSPKKGFHMIDCMTRRIDLGLDAYERGSISPQKLDRLVETLNEFGEIMQGLRVDSYRMVGTSALREIKTGLVTHDIIERRTGLKLLILSNTEQRFLDYKAIASQTESFEQVIKKGTAIVDIGGSSLQISVFDKDKLITTQNVRIGKIATRSRFYPLAKNNEHFEKILAELLDHELYGFEKLYQKDRRINTLIATNKELQTLFSTLYPNRPVLTVTREEFDSAYNSIVYMNAEEITERYSIPFDLAQALVPSAIICKGLLDMFESDGVWLPDVSIGDGLAYDYAVANKAVSSAHSFDEDILAASRSIAKRYKSHQPHIRNVEENSLAIFDKMKKIHNLGKRERLLLQISAILHNCGKYISLTDVADCAYNILLVTEIIGLSQSEQRIVANIIRFNTLDFPYYEELSQTTNVSREEYIVIAKLTAILKAANALDRSHHQRVTDIRVSVKGDEVILGVLSDKDLTLERGTLEEKDSLFEEVYNLKPVLHQTSTARK